MAEVMLCWAEQRMSEEGVTRCCLYPYHARCSEPLPVSSEAGVESWKVFAHTQTPKFLCPRLMLTSHLTASAPFSVVCLLPSACTQIFHSKVRWLDLCPLHHLVLYPVSHAQGKSHSCGSPKRRVPAHPLCSPQLLSFLPSLSHRHLGAHISLIGGGRSIWECLLVTHSSMLRRTPNGSQETDHTAVSGKELGSAIYKARASSLYYLSDIQYPFFLYPPHPTHISPEKQKSFQPMFGFVCLFVF